MSQDYFRQYYAGLFNCYDYSVKYWDELEPSQQDQAAGLYSGINMPGYVYHVSVATGTVIARRFLHYTDPQSPEYQDRRAGRDDE